MRDEPEVKALYARVAAYLDRLDAAGVSDRDLQRTLSRGDALARIARHLMLIVVWLPLALPGAILHAPAGSAGAAGRAGADAAQGRAGGDEVAGRAC